MATLTGYKGLLVVEGAAGEGGEALTDDLKLLADRIESSTSDLATHIADVANPHSVTVSQDATPQLAGNLDVAANKIYSSTANQDMIVEPNGTGAFRASSGGNARGDYAVDLQMSRVTATQVAQGLASVIGGGYANTASGLYVVISGGQTNSITASFGFIGGGLENEADASYCMIPGGLRAKATMYGQKAHASGYFSAVGDAQTSVLVMRRTTTTASPLEMYLDGDSVTDRMVLNDQDAWAFSILVVARRTDGDNEGAVYKFEGGIDNNGGTVALIGSIVKTVIAEDTAAWDVIVSADDANNSLKLTAYGEAAKNIQWVARVELVQVNG